MRDRALLVFLALQTGMQHRDRVAGLLWEDRPEAQARQSLRQSLAALRRTGVPVVSDGKEMLALGPGMTCDALDFARSVSGPGLEQIREAVSLCDGVLLADWHGNLPAFESWLQVERERLAKRAVAACLTLIGWKAPALPAAERLSLSRKALDMDPYLETAHRSELMALSEMGLRSEAIHLHLAFARRLKDDLGILPDRETDQLVAGLRNSRAPIGGEMQRAKPPPKRSRLCVFSLKSPASQNDHAYLCSGIMNEVAAALSRFHSFDVLPPSSSRGLSEHAGDLHKAARESLQADFLLDGTLSIESGHVTIALYLHNTETGLLIWNWKTEQSNPDYRVISQEIAHVVAQRIDSRIEQERVTALHESSPEELEGYDLWLRAQHLLLEWKSGTEEQAAQLLHRALVASPRLARAHSSLALLYNAQLLTLPGYPNDLEDRRKALHHAKLAVECDPQDPRSHIAMMWVAIWMCDRTRAERHMQIAHDLNPHSADVLMHVALAKANLADPRAGLEFVAEAMALNPLFPDWYSYFYAVALVLAGEYAQALAVGSSCADQFLELPGWLAIAAALMRDDDTASQMAGLLREGTRENWVGEEPWTPEVAAEWFISVNRWLTGHERELVDSGLRKAGLLP